MGLDPQIERLTRPFLIRHSDGAFLKINMQQAANLALAQGQMPIEFWPGQGKIGIFFATFIDLLGKLPSEPVKRNPKFAT